MIKVAIIGFGGMGEVHANCYKKMSDSVEVVAIADLREERRNRAAELFENVKTFETAQELLDNVQIDAADICLPTFLHAQYAVEAMEKGFAVFVEKPVCLNGDEAEKLIEVQKRTGAKAAVGHVIRFWKEYMWLKETKESGIYGRLMSGTFTRVTANPHWAWENWFNDCDRSGTEALDLHIHDLDFVRYLMENDTISEVNSLASRNGDGVIVGMNTLIKYENTAISLDSSWGCTDTFPFKMNFRANFEKATVMFENDKLTVYPAEGEAFCPEFGGAGKEDEAGEKIINLSTGDAYYSELRYFVDCISQGREPEIAPLCESTKSVVFAEREIERAGGRKI